MFKPELLAPAGTLKSLKYAFAYGADAIYAGQPRYSLRTRNNEFNLENLTTGIEIARTKNKRFYVVSNLAPHNSKVKTYLKDMEPVMDLQPDALIMSDPGLIMLIRQHWPEQTIHLSVQANAVNYAAVQFWQNMGLKRVILSRELSLEEIAEIKQQCPGMELEVFVHGALCIAYSGRCLLSGYMNRRDPNQGVCTNACRWKYAAHEAKETDAGDIIKNPLTEWQPDTTAKDEQLSGENSTSNKIMLLEEHNRPGELMPAYEDEHGTHIMNSKDLRAVQHVKRFCEIGMHSLKIEGRTKSHFYVARTTLVYRKAIDDAVQGKAFDMDLMDILEGLANRGYTEGFYRRHVHDEFQNYLTGNSSSSKQQFVGEIVDYDSSTQLLSINVKNHFEVGDSIELMTPAGNQMFTLKNLESRKGEKITVAPGSGHIVKLPLPVDFPTTNENLSHGLLIKNF